MASYAVSLCAVLEYVNFLGHAGNALGATSLSRAQFEVDVGLTVWWQVARARDAPAVLPHMVGCVRRPVRVTVRWQTGNVLLIGVWHTPHVQVQKHVLSSKTCENISCSVNESPNTPASARNLRWSSTFRIVHALWVECRCTLVRSCEMLCYTCNQQPF